MYTKTCAAIARLWSYRQHVGHAYLVAADAVHAWDNGHRGLRMLLALFTALESGSWFSLVLTAMELILTITLIVQVAWGAIKHLKQLSENRTDLS